MTSQYFSKKKAAELRQQFDLKETHQGIGLHRRLQGSAEIYFQCKNGIDALEPNRDVRDQMEAISNATERLTGLLTKLTPDAQSALLKTIGQDEIEMVSISIGAPEATAYEQQRFTLSSGLEFRKTNLPDGSHMNQWYSFEDISASLTHLQSYATQTGKSLSIRTPGRRQKEALRMWILNCAHIWRHFKDERFSVTYHKGEATSSAAIFCVKALQIIDPSILEREVVTAMRSFVSRAKAKKSQEMGG
ncbi:MAG: hypothetical protein RLN89_10260 [Parvibaculum sp.]